MSAIEGFCDVRTEPADLNKALIADRGRTSATTQEHLTVARNRRRARA